MSLYDQKPSPLPGLQKPLTEQKPSTEKSVSLEEKTYSLDSLSPIARGALEKKLCVTCELFTNKLRKKTEDMGRNPFTELDHKPIIMAFKFENPRRDGVKKDWPKGDLLCDPLVTQIDKKYARTLAAKALKKETQNG